MAVEQGVDHPILDPPPLNTFVIRFWQGAGSRSTRWHGQIRHVQSGEQASFATAAALLQFLRRWVAMRAESIEKAEGGGP